MINRQIMLVVFVLGASSLHVTSCQAMLLRSRYVEYPADKLYNEACACDKGLYPNKRKAFELYLEAAKQGHVDAQFAVATCYDDGEGVEKNSKKAFEWYFKAAMQGCVNAQFNVAFCYRNGEGVEKNTQQAIYWYKKAAEQGDAGARAALEHW